MYRDLEGNLLVSLHPSLRLLFLDVDGVLNAICKPSEQLVAAKVELIGDVAKQVDNALFDFVLKKNINEIDASTNSSIN